MFGFKYGHTDYRVSAIPLGGYVKLGGDESNAPIEGDGASDIPAAERFDLRPRWQRILVAVAGPVMNVLTALAIPLAAALMYGVPATPAPVVNAIAAGGAAEIAGLQVGDRIVSFNGAQNPDWDTIRDDAVLSPDQPLPMIVERNHQQVQLTIKPTAVTHEGETGGELDFIPDYGDVSVVLNGVNAGSPADQAGFKAGDQVVAVGGQPVKSSEQVVQYIRGHKADSAVVDVNRNGQTLKLTAKVPAEGLIGVGISQRSPNVRVGPVAALRFAVDSNVHIVRVTAKAIGQIFEGKRSARNTLSGPIGIYRVTSAATIELGWAGVFAMLGFLSLNLGIVNLLPIPVLDGGAIFLLIVEKILTFVGMTLSNTVREAYSASWVCGGDPDHGVCDH